MLSFRERKRVMAHGKEDRKKVVGDSSSSGSRRRRRRRVAERYAIYRV